MCEECLGDPEPNELYMSVLLLAERRKEQKIFELMEIILSIRSDTPPETALSISRGIFRYAQVFNIPHMIYVCIMKRESGFDPEADENRGAGLMQIVPRYHQEIMEAYNFRRKDLYNIENNILMGSLILDYGVKRNGSVWWGLYYFSGGNSNYANNICYCAKIKY
jgi:Soluble lytic murein transglycosylase and related regulatory proteins (some contain LysM/invasin domains)